MFIFKWVGNILDYNFSGLSVNGSYEIQVVIIRELSYTVVNREGVVLKKVII